MGMCQCELEKTSLLLKVKQVFTDDFRTIKPIHNARQNAEMVLKISNL